MVDAKVRRAAREDEDDEDEEEEEEAAGVAVACFFSDLTGVLVVLVATLVESLSLFDVLVCFEVVGAGFMVVFLPLFGVLFAGVGAPKSNGAISTLCVFRRFLDATADRVPESSALFLFVTILRTLLFQNYRVPYGEYNFKNGPRRDVQ